MELAAQLQAPSCYSRICLGPSGLGPLSTSVIRDSTVAKPVHFCIRCKLYLLLRLKCLAATMSLELLKYFRVRFFFAASSDVDSKIRDRARQHVRLLVNRCHLNIVEQSTCWAVLQGWGFGLTSATT